MTRLLLISSVSATCSSLVTHSDATELGERNAATYVTLLSPSSSLRIRESPTLISASSSHTVTPATVRSAATFRTKPLSSWL